MVKPSGQLESLARLRGMAALFVVFGHAFNIGSLVPAHDVLGPLYISIASSTVIFVVIAGILFQMKAVPKLDAGLTSTGKILRKRWAELSGTYLTMGLLLAMIIGIKEGIRYDVNPLVPALRAFLNGSMAHSYWYVPFFLLLMCLAPLHLMFSKLNLVVQTILIVLGLALSSIVHRPDPFFALGAVHSLIYYLPVFWIGLVVGAHWQAVLSWVQGKELALAFVFLLLVGLQMEIGQKTVYLTRIGQNSDGIDLFVLQKVTVSMIFISIYHRTRNLELPVLDWISRHSLTIFFMHSPVLYMIEPMPHLSGFYLPELLLATAFMILASVQINRTFVRFYAKMPGRHRQFAEAVREARFRQALSMILRPARASWKGVLSGVPDRRGHDIA